MSESQTNKQALTAAVYRWIEEARDLTTNRGAAVLNSRADQIEGYIRQLDRLPDNKPTPQHLVGLDYWILSALADRLRIAANGLERKREAA